jgi:hypothetical protein
MDGTTEDRELLLRILEAAETVVEEQLLPTSASAQAALDELRKATRNYRLGQLEGDDDDVVVRAQRCERCRCPIFFARTINNRWMPMETEPIDASGIPPSARWVVVFDRTVRGTGAAYVVARPLKDYGQVWVSHFDTCGARDGPRHKVPPLLARWKANVERCTSEEGLTRAALETLSRRFSEDNPRDADA